MSGLAVTLFLSGEVLIRQWSEVNDLCHKRMQFSHVRVFSDACTVQKRATKSDTSGHCLVLVRGGVARIGEGPQYAARQRRLVAACVMKDTELEKL